MAETGTSKSRAFAFMAGFALLAIAAILAFALTGGAGSAAAKKKKSSSSKRNKPGSKLSVATSTFSIAAEDVGTRYEVYCNKGYRPFGGGEFTSPTVDNSGAGVYPTSYERLGQQEGFHSTIIEHGTSAPTSVTLQVFCRKLKGNIDPTESFTNVGPGETRVLTASCKKGKNIVMGGYLTSQFFATKGVYVTESRRLNNKTWTVTATGVAGGKGGDVSPIAYCLQGAKPVEVVSPPATVVPPVPAPVIGGTQLPGVNATATAPVCPGKTKLVGGGFSSPADGSVRIYDTYLGPSGAWQVSGTAYTGGGPVTAYAYCF
jgi:hypothetical protein